MKIIGVPGIKDSKGMDPMWNIHFGPAFETHFPGVTFYAERRKDNQEYDFWQIRKIRKFRDELVAKYDTGEDVVFVGHSMGAMVALAAASRFKKSKIPLVAAVNPLRGILFTIFSWLIGCKPIKVPIILISARHDEVIPDGEAYPKAAAHITLPIDHHRDLMKNFLGVAGEIAQAAREVFERGPT